MIKVVIGKKASGQELKWADLDSEQLLTLASTPALFGGSETFLLVGALNSERGEEFIELAAHLADSPHTFIFEEEKLLKAERTALEKAGAKIEEVKKVVKEYKFDNFGVAEALGKRDKKALWLGLTRSFREGEKAEAVAGLMCWKARAIGDVALSRQLVRLYHDSHRGAGELELLLERFALKL